MGVEDEIGVFVEAKSHAVGLDVGRGTRLPEEEMAVGIEDLGLDDELHAAEACAGFFFLAASGLAAIDQNVRVMNEALVAGANLDGFQPARAIDRRAKDEIPVGVGAAGGQREGFLRFDDHVGLAELPALDELRLGGKIGGIAFGRALIDPGLNAGDLFDGEAEIVGKVQIAGFGKPRRHDAGLRDGGDLVGVEFSRRRR